jgi:GDSL-like Lipase/Acylhydrolase family
MTLSLAVSLAAAEAILRFKNSTMRNYDIEMWRYAKELKRRSSDPDLSFEHVRSASAILESVPITLNEFGLRGASVKPIESGERRILFLGGSITLGWGVAEAQTLEMRLRGMLQSTGEKVEVLNGGVGNYNTVRYVSRYFKDLTDIKVTDIVVHYFLRDAEDLKPDSGNFLLRHSELAVTLWMVYHRLVDRNGEASLVDHYRAVYQPSAPGFIRMKEMLGRLAAHAKAQHVRIWLAMTPDIHNLGDYKLGFVHEIMRQVAEDDGYAFIDLLPALSGHRPEDLFAMPGDPHPNALGHELMAEAIFRAMTRATAAGSAER